MIAPDSLRKQPSGALLLGFTIALTSLTGCSTFQRDWDETLQAEPGPPRPVPELAGCYEGEWRSDANGHSGRLRMILGRDPARPGAYRARFRANWGDVFTFEYSVPLVFREVRERLRCSGQADLGAMAGGAFEYQGSLLESAAEDRQPLRLIAVYDSTNDHGVFTLDRVEGGSDS